MARFEREARQLASLNHPNIAAIHGLEQSEGLRFLVLELVEGPTLAERIAVRATGRSPLPIDEVLDICRQIAEGLEAAHEKGVNHIFPLNRARLAEHPIAEEEADPHPNLLCNALCESNY